VFCNGSEVCDLALGCIPGPLPCDDGAECSTDICIEEIFSCEWAANDALCDDGLFCNGGETCQVFSGCLVGTPPCSGDESCDEVLNQCALACVTATNGEHAGAARARLELETVYLANGSDDFLGISAEDVTSLSGGGSYWERVDSCSAAPAIDTLDVQVVGSVAIVTGTASDANGDLAQVIVTFNVFGIPLQVPAQGTSEFSAVVPGFFPGQYTASAQAFDESGVASAPSAPVIFEVLTPAAPRIDSIEAVPNGGAPVIRGTASDPNGDIEKVVVTVLSDGVVVASAESSDFDPFSVTLEGLPAGVYTARAQAVDMSGLASALSPEVSFAVEEGAAVQCITATNAEHQEAGRAIGLFGDIFFLAVGSNDFLGVGGSSVTSLSGAGESWDRVDDCAAATPFPAQHLVLGPTPPVVIPPQ
jgi:hypothetical protein